MKTQIIEIDRDNINQEFIERAAKALRAGRLVAFPTETVYGLGANAFDAKAIETIFKAKGRPSDNPLIVHISDKKQLTGLVKSVPKKAQQLIDVYWPGPLTLIFKKHPRVPDIATAGLDSVAVRMPSHPVAWALINAARVPIAAPSANLSGKPSPTTAAHVIKDLNGRVDIIIDSGKADIGLESTVLDTTKSPFMILRPGGLTLESLSRYVPVVLHPKLKSGKLDNIERPESPGMKYRHYAPKAKLLLLNGDLSKLTNAILELSRVLGRQGLKVGVLSLEDGNFGKRMAISAGGNKKKFARILFDSLRKFDDASIDVILVAGLDSRGIGRAVMNRLEKAADYRVVDI